MMVFNNLLGVSLASLIYGIIGMVVIQDRTTDEVVKTKKEAARIATKGWIPSHFMIDKSLAEKNAIQQGIGTTHLNSALCSSQVTVWPGAIIRVCQFHIIQAIVRWVEERGRGESGKSSKKTGKYPKKAGDGGKLSLSTKAMKEVLEAFRWAQRSRNTADDRWVQAQIVFESNLQRICRSYNYAESLNAITKYFRDNWWCGEWRGKLITTSCSLSLLIEMGKISAQISGFHRAKPVMQPLIQTTGQSQPFVHLMSFS